MLEWPSAVIILDTNVVSELTSAHPEPAVVAWFAGHTRTELYITVITEAELLFGVENLPSGPLRNSLAAGDERMIEVVLAGRVLPFGREAARHYAQIRAARERIGRRIGYMDCMIAAIARVNGAAVATRNVPDFENCGVEVVNPWGN